ncbi:prostaglandin G/H synthase 2-like [Styela clava]
MLEKLKIMKPYVTILIFLGLLQLFIIPALSEKKNYDPCCSYPCQHFGICTRIGFSDGYTCDCYRTGYYGDNCEIETWKHWYSEIIRPSPYTVQAILTNGKWFWQIVNNIKVLHSFFMTKILQLKAMSPVWPEAHNTAADYTTFDGYANKTYWALTIPPVPKNCPTPAGVAGPRELPDAETLVKTVFTRTEFKPCPRGTSVIVPFYGQHFTHQGFKSRMPDRSMTWGSHMVDGSHIYGETLEKQHALRTMSGGKMKMQIYNGEEYPPNVKDCPGIYMQYPAFVKEENKFALGHPLYGMLPSLVYYTTLWLREHNRACDIMAELHPDWDDERLFQTTKLIVLGEIMKITIETYVQHVSGMHFQLTYEPHLLHDLPMRWSSSRIHVEFNTLYHWHNLIPDYFLIGDRNYSLPEIYYNMNPLLDHGMNVFTTSLSNQIAGRGAGGRNMPESLHRIAIETVKMNRKVRLQPFNRYRQYFRLPPYKTFEDLTGETKFAKVLSDIYGGDIDAVEFYIGIMVEKRYKSKMWGITLNEAISSYSLRSVFSSTIGSPEYWKESTFGGKVGFDLVKTTNMQNLVCRNIQGCPKIQFQIPEDVNEDKDPGMIYNDCEQLKAETINQKTEL